MTKPMERIVKEKKDWTSTYKKPKNTKKKTYATPEEVAAYESMKNKHNDVHTVAKPKLRPKNPKHNKTQKSPTKLFDDPIYSMDIFTLREIPKSDMFIEQIAAKLVTWVLTEIDKKLVFDRFLREIGYEDTSFYNFMKRSKKLKAAYNFTLMSIGVTREEGMLLNKLNASGVMNSMPAYSKRWKELAEWRASLQTKEPDKPTTINVNVPNMVQRKVKKNVNTKK